MVRFETFDLALSEVKSGQVLAYLSLRKQKNHTLRCNLYASTTGPDLYDGRDPFQTAVNCGSSMTATCDVIRVRFRYYCG